MDTNLTQVTDSRGRYRLEVAADDHIGRTIERTGKPYEHRLLSLLTAQLRPGDIVLDVGANIGNHTVAFARVGARVEAVEANPDAADILERNITSNNLADRVTVHRVGLSDREGRGVARVRIPGNLGSASVEVDDNGPVRLVTLSDLAVPRPLRLVKIDVEGAEIAVLRGCLPVLRQDRPILVVELLYASQRKEAQALLSPLGYRMIPVSLSGEPTFAFVAAGRDAIGLVRRPRFVQQAMRRALSRMRHPFR